MAPGMSGLGVEQKGQDMAGTIDIRAPEAPPTSVISIEQRLEQIEAAINNAHATCNNIRAPDSDQSAQERPSGALSAADHCIDELARLNERLSGIAGLVGAL